MNQFGTNFKDAQNLRLRNNSTNDLALSISSWLNWQLLNAQLQNSKFFWRKNNPEYFYQISSKHSENFIIINQNAIRDKLINTKQSQTKKMQPE